MIKSYSVKYRIRESGQVVDILMFGSDFADMFKRNSDILLLDIEVLSIILQKPTCYHDKPVLGHCIFIACPNYRENCEKHKSGKPTDLSDC